MWRCRSSATRASSPPGSRGARAQSSTSRPVNGCSTPEASANRATATRGPPGCCWTSRRRRPPSGAPSTTWPAQPARFARRACPTHSPSAWSTVNDHARRLAIPPAGSALPLRPGRHAGRRDPAARLLRELRRRPDPGGQRRPPAERFRSGRAGSGKRRRGLRHHRISDPQDRTGLLRASFERRCGPTQQASRRHLEAALGCAQPVQAAACAGDRHEYDLEDHHHHVHPPDRQLAHHQPEHPDEHHRTPQRRWRHTRARRRSNARFRPRTCGRPRRRRRPRQRGRGGRRPGSGQMSDQESTGVQIAGRYRLEGRLGFGGMSTVHLAKDLRLERPVAVKLLAEHLAEDPTFVSRFQREAQAAARLGHPNVVQVFDSGQDETTGQYFIVMESISIIEQACDGLDYAHRHGVVHRDVKPGNLLRSREGEVKLADFGIAKATEQSSITQVGSVLGTAAYLAPEQARGEEAGPSADLYALGVVTYQLISGRLPYEAASLTELALSQQQEAPPMLDALVAAVSPELADAVAISLALDARDRYQTAREMGRALSDGAKGIAPQRPAGGRGTPPTEATSLLARTPGSGGSRPPQSATAVSGAVTPRRPRQGPPREQAPAIAPARASAAGDGRRARRSVGSRILIGLSALALLAVVVLAVDLITTPAPTKVVLRNVVYSEVQQASSALKQLVLENTK